ncbi:MAG: hypothetical protein WCP89_03260, partial [archaeon]
MLSKRYNPITRLIARLVISKENSALIAPKNDRIITTILAQGFAFHKPLEINIPITPNIRIITPAPISIPLNIEGSKPFSNSAGIPALVNAALDIAVLIRGTIKEEPKIKNIPKIIISIDN